MPTPEHPLEEALIEKLRSLKYAYRPDITDRATLEQNFREKFEALNRVRLTDGEFPRLLDARSLECDGFWRTSTINSLQ